MILKFTADQNLIIYYVNTNAIQSMRLCAPGSSDASYPIFIIEYTGGGKLTFHGKDAIRLHQLILDAIKVVDLDGRIVSEDPPFTEEE